MKTPLRMLAAAGCMAASIAQADTLLGLYVGAQGWDMDTSGGFANTVDLRAFDFSGETVGSYYAAFEHPVPFLPNAKIVYTDMDNSASTLLTQPFVFADQLYASGSVINSQNSLTSTDYILYYEFFDNDLVSFDFGFAGKDIDGSFLVTAQDDPSRTSVQDFSGVVPSLYTRLAVGLPFTGLGAYVEGSFLSFDHTVYDYQAGLTYSFIESLAIDMTLQLGYRTMSLELDDMDDFYSAMDYDGAFAGLEIHF